MLIEALSLAGRHKSVRVSLYFRESSHCEREVCAAVESVLTLVYANIASFCGGASSVQLFSWQQLGNVGFMNRADQHCVLSLLPVFLPKL